MNPTGIIHLQRYRARMGSCSSSEGNSGGCCSGGGCCSNSSTCCKCDKHPTSPEEKLEHEGWQELHEKPRRCTNCLAGLLLVASWVALTIIGLIVTGVIEPEQNTIIEKGNPLRLVNAIDYKGQLCGSDSGVASKKYGYYLPDFTAVCVRACPTTTDYTEFICQYDQQGNANNTFYGYYLVAQKKCMYQIKTKTYLNRCIPDLNTLDAATEAALTASGAGVAISESQMIYNTASEKGTNWFNTFLADFLLLRGYIFGFGIGVTVLIAFLYLFFLRIPGLLFIVLWSMICGIFGLLVTGSWLLWELANTWSADGLHSNAEIKTMRTFAYFGMAVTILYFCLIVVLRKRVMLAIGIIIQAARALSAMPTILALPIVQAIGLVAFLIPWVIYVLYLASSGQMMTLTGTYTYAGVEYTYKYRSFEYTQNTKYVFLYMLFTWFWTSEFILAIGQVIIALCFAAWYFSRDKSKIGFGTVSWAFRAGLLYHGGTAAFGSLIIAIIKTIRVVLAYIQKKAKKTKNKVVEYAMCILQCVMWCFEKIIKFINKHAYIITAIYGTPFCTSTRKAFFLLLRNILRVAAVNMVATFVMFLGKIFVPLATTFVCYLAIAYGVDSDEISGLIAPLVFCFLLSCWVTSMFIEIFGMGIESILFCYIADEEMFKPEDRFAEAELADTIKKTAEKALALKKKKKKQEDDAKAEATEGDGYAPVDQSEVEADQKESGVQMQDVVVKQPDAETQI